LSTIITGGTIQKSTKKYFCGKSSVNSTAYAISKKVLFLLVLRSRSVVYNSHGMTLREYMTANNLCPANLAARAGLNRATISRWYSGEQKPTLKAAVAVWHATGGAVRPETLLDELTNPQS
jgi:DNA-binding phage protein